MPKNAIPDIHIGNLIRQELKDQNYSIARLARQLGCDPSNLCKTLSKEEIHTNLLLRISVILRVDFFEFISKKFKKYGVEFKKKYGVELKIKSPSAPI